MMTSQPSNDDTHGHQSRLAAEVEDALAARALGEDRVVALGRYRLVRIIGHGGMGQVFEAWDPQLERHVAIKLVLQGGAQATLEEARCLARVAHPNVVCVHEVGHVGEYVYIAMELVDGPDLRGWLQAARRERAEILKVMLAAGRGLAAVHDAGLLHGDVKPGNVLIGRDGRVRVADFGLARADAQVDTDAASSKPELDELVRRALAAVDEELLADDGSVQSERLGRADWLGPCEESVALAELRALLVSTPSHGRAHGGGTLPYMAPERRRGEVGGPAADQYSFCATVWEALFDQVPEPGGGCRSKDAIEQVLRRGLAEQPHARWPSMHALCSALEQALERQAPILDRRRVRRAAAVGLVAALGVAALYVAQDQDSAVECQHLNDMWTRWGPPQRAALGLRFAGSQLPRSEARFVISSLDAWADSWTALWSRSCGAEPELRGCLEHERARFEAVLGLLEGGSGSSEESLGAARALVTELGSPTSCLDPNRGPSRDVAMIGELAELSAIERRIELALLSSAPDLAAAELRRFDATLDTLALEVDPAELDLRSLAIAPLRARVLTATGQAGRARTGLREALHEAEARGDEQLRFALLLEQTRLAARVAAGSYEREAFGWQEPALPDDDPALREPPTLDDLAMLDGLAERVGASPVERAELSLIRAGIVIARGAYGDRESLKRLIEELEAAGEALSALQPQGFAELRVELALRRAQLHFAVEQFGMVLRAVQEVRAIAASPLQRASTGMWAALTLEGASAALLGDCAGVGRIVGELLRAAGSSQQEIIARQEELRSLTEAVDWASVHRACNYHGRDLQLLVTGR